MPKHKGEIGKTLKIFLREIRSHPREYRSLYARKIKMFLNGYEIPANLSYDLFRKNHSVLKLCFFNFVIVSPLALLGIFLAWGRHRRESLLRLFLFVLSFSAIAFHIQGRYRIPAVPFFIVYAAYAAYWLGWMIKEKRLLPAGCGILAVTVISFYTEPDDKIIKKYFGTRIRYLDYANLGVAYTEKAVEATTPEKVKKRYLRRAEENFIRAAEVAPGYLKPEYLVCLGWVYFQSGRHEEARRVLLQVLKLAPDNQMARYWLETINRTVAGEETGAPEN